MIAFDLLVVTAAVGAAVPATLYFLNVRLYRRLNVGGTGSAKVSVLIPARNEEASIAAAVEAALQEGVEEVIVLDDQSDDATAAVVREIASKDARVRLEQNVALPAGWCGKQFACHRLGALARGELLLFLDADVRLEPGAVVRMAEFMQRSKAALASGFPRQMTVGMLEKLLIPMMHFLLLGFLPMARMKASVHPAYAAGCGQLFMARAKEYREIGGHSLVKGSLHDGITLPRAYRERGLRTDLFDATDLACCRMYRTPGQVWNGLMKNATEGLGAPRLIGPATALLIVGQVLPFGLLAWALMTGAPGWAACEAGITCAAVLLVRVNAAVRFRQTLLGALLHPVGIVLLLIIQWWALIRKLTGRKTAWKGRAYA